MTLVLKHCSNPGCHRPYTAENYGEILTLRELQSGDLNYFAISLCMKCIESINEHIVRSALRDSVDYEIQSNNESIVLTKQQKIDYRMKESNYRFIAWGRNREGLDDKLKS